MALVIIVAVALLVAGLSMEPSAVRTQTPLPQKAGPQSRVDGSLFFAVDAGLGVF